MTLTAARVPKQVLPTRPNSIISYFVRKRLDNVLKIDMSAVLGTYCNTILSWPLMNLQPYTFC